MACLRRGLGCWVLVLSLSWADPSPVLAGGPLQMENYRAQFDRVLRYASIDNLLKRLQEKLTEREG